MKRHHHKAELQDAELEHRDKIEKSHIFQEEKQEEEAAIEMIDREYEDLFS